MEAPQLTMLSDYYKVEVLYFRNPHLIWVEVRDSAIVSAEEHGIKFEQIGIYGVLPLETTLELDSTEIRIQRSSEWVPAAASLMRKFIAGESDILFTPFLLDRRFSVFDDNIHKFGDLVIKKRSGITKSLSKMLRTSGFATYNERLFHKHLDHGKICTRLNNIEIQEVLSEIEKYYYDKNDPQKRWGKSMTKNTSIVRVSQEFEQALTKTNLDKHNKSMKAILESKNRDLELCKGVDEPSLGRATTRKRRELKKSTPEEMKLELLQSYRTKADSRESDTNDNTSNEHTQAFEDTKIFLEANASPYPIKITSKTDEHKSQILKKVMSKAAIKKIMKEEKLMNKQIREPKEKVKRPRVVRKPLNESVESISTSSTRSVSTSESSNVIKAAAEIDEANNFAKIDNPVDSTCTQDQQLLNNEDIACNNSVTKNEEIAQEPTHSLPVQEHQEKKLNNYNREVRHRRFSKGKAKKVKAEETTSTRTEASQEIKKKGSQTSSTSSQTQASNHEIQNSRRGPEALKNSELFGSTVVGKLKKRGKKHAVASRRTKAFFGPPGLNMNALNRVPPVLLYDNNGTGNNGQQASNISDRFDSTDGRDNVVGPTADKSTSTSDCSENNRMILNERNQASEIRKQRHQKKETSSSSSSVWERRLKLHKTIAKNKRCASQTSNTTNKDSFKAEENIPHTYLMKKNIDIDCDGKISGPLDELALVNQNFTYTTESTEHAVMLRIRDVVVKANPFKNLDLNNSVFVENLVTPILMVHSKMNRPFNPTSIYSDVHFNVHIRLVLKNLGFSRPMLMQTITWNAILRGHSIFMVGPRNSGKTMGYLPAVCRLVMDCNQSEANCKSIGPFCVIVCATSYAVSEVEKIARMLVGNDEKVVSCYYGYDELAIATSLLNGCDLLVTTAPSLVRLLQMPDFGLDLRRLTTFVLDDFERLSYVYGHEIKFCLRKINDMLNLRLNKELKVQYVVASRIWCPIMEPFSRNASDTVVCIGAFEECVLYSKANVRVRFVKSDSKLNHVIDFLKDIEPSKRTVIVCDSDEEVHYLKTSIHSTEYFIFATNSEMTVQDLYHLSNIWNDFNKPLVAPVLICTDINLYHLNLVNVNYLVHYSMPSLYSIFGRRFSTLIESYPSIFGTQKNHIKILIFLDENNTEQLPKMIRFVKRCTDDVSVGVDEVCSTILTEKDMKRARNLAPLCNMLMALGECPEVYDCKFRHTIFKKYDTPKDWMPKSGVITFKIMHYQNAALYSVRLIGNYDSGRKVQYSSTYTSISLKMGMYYSNQKNRILLGSPRAGDICSVCLTNNMFLRARIILITQTYERGSPKNILIDLIDEGLLDVTTENNLYHLPNYLKCLESYVVHVRLANVQPRDKDITFSDLAVDDVQQLATAKKGTYMQGNIVLTVGRCIFVDTLEVYEELKSIKQVVVLSDVKKELLERHVEVNRNHIVKLQKLCVTAGLEILPRDIRVNEDLPSVKVTHNISWAHLDEDMSTVEFGIVENPNILFVRLTKFNKCLKMLISDIQKYVSDNKAQIERFNKDDIVLAEYPDDGIYERARIEEVGDETIKCFFVDQGEWRDLKKDKFVTIPDKFISQLPFQAIQCRFLGITPSGDQWNDFSENWLFNKADDTNPDKQFFVKYYTKDPAEFTGGHKYGVVFIDTYGQEDIILNQVMLNLNMGTEITEELKFLNLVKSIITSDLKRKEEVDDTSSEKISICSTNSVSTPIPTSNVLLEQPIRSVPLIGTDESDDSEKWNINFTDEMAAMFNPVIEKSMTEDQSVLPSIESKDTELQQDIETTPETIKQSPSLDTHYDSSKELDSDDLSEPEATQPATETLEMATVDKIEEETENKIEKATEKKIEKATVNEKEKATVDKIQVRKPKLIWRQAKSTVFVKIMLVGVEAYHLEIHDRALKFAAVVNGISYDFEFCLYGVIDKKSANHSNKGQYILVKLNKIRRKRWLTLTKDEGSYKWIVYDFDSIDTSSEEEEVQKDDLCNIVRNERIAESDSDHDIADDVVHTYKDV